jgi:hypothetical protein
MDGRECERNRVRNRDGRRGVNRESRVYSQRAEKRRKQRDDRLRRRLTAGLSRQSRPAGECLNRARHRRRNRCRYGSRSERHRRCRRKRLTQPNEQRRADSRDQRITEWAMQCCMCRCWALQDEDGRRQMPASYCAGRLRRCCRAGCERARFSRRLRKARRHD